ncbi:MAG: hypothetical protein EOO73_18440 [Myxococcales bacterium]|nr:MAG: hypothetical protein EOO73_18440 [Myxococcales bacterium]
MAGEPALPPPPAEPALLPPPPAPAPAPATAEAVGGSSGNLPSDRLGSRRELSNRTQLASVQAFSRVVWS